MTNINSIYKKRFEVALQPIARNIENELKDILLNVKNIDRIVARAKSIDRFLLKSNKIEKGRKKYSDPISQIQDQIGARIITFYIEDVELVSREILRYYREIERKKLIPESESEFGYVGNHFILLINQELIPEDVPKTLVPNFFELQVKTLFQHAFSEASHDLAYKPSSQLTKEQKRKVAFTAAQAWGADMVLSDLSKEIFFK
jgi:putative GTP pyrophosphokinase